MRFAFVRKRHYTTGEEESVMPWRGQVSGSYLAKLAQRLFRMPGIRACPGDYIDPHFWPVNALPFICRTGGPG